MCSLSNSLAGYAIASMATCQRHQLPFSKACCPIDTRVKLRKEVPASYLVQSFVDFLEGVRRLFAFRRDDDADVDDDELVAGRQLSGAAVRQVGGGVVGVVDIGVVPVRRDLNDLKKIVRES